MTPAAVVAIIPQDEQAYRSLGDYHRDGETLAIFATELPDKRASYAIAVHELVEALLMEFDGVPLQASTDFDLAWEARADAGEVTTDEPGEDPAAPYRAQHAVADVIERLFVHAAGLKWADYEAMCEAVLAGRAPDNRRV